MPMKHAPAEAFPSMGQRCAMSSPTTISRMKLPSSQGATGSYHGGGKRLCLVAHR